MIVAAKYRAIWAYVLGPVIGGVLGALLYDRFLAAAQEPSEADAS